MMAKLVLSLFGSFHATLDGEPVTRFPYDKVRALLAYLAVESDRAHRRETLAGLLWPDMPERRARQNLSQALYDLRRVLGQEGAVPYLVATRHTLQFDPHRVSQVDVETFEALLEACRAHSHVGPEVCEACIDRMQQAVSLYRGEFLAGFSLPDSPPFEEWSLLLRERFHRLVTEALGRLARGQEQRGKIEAAAQWAARWAELESWNENAHRLVMRLLAAAGERAAALAQYETCCRILGEELGVEPEPATVKLYERILDARITPRDGPRTAANLPAWLTPMIGREREVREVADRLRDPACRLLTLFGPGGIGKTRLGVEAARTMQDAFPHGIFFVSLAALRSVESIYPMIAEAIGFAAGTSGTDKRTLRQQLLDYVGDKRMLLILDSFEHLIERPESGPAPHDLAASGCGGPVPRDGRRLVAALLQAAPSLKTLVTSRVRLNVQGECLYAVEGLEVPPLQRPAGGVPEEYGAVQLFLSAVQRVDGKWSPTPADLAHIGQICRRLDGMPLGILLAAGWIEVLSPAEIASELSQGVDLLQTEYGDLPERQRSMRAVFDQSWGLLTPKARAVMCALSVFRGGCTRQAAQVVAGADLHELMALVHRSRLQHGPGPGPGGLLGRYGVHELLRQYAEEKLDATPDRGRGVRDRHAAYYTAALHRWASDLKGARQEQALQEMDVEIENARAAWDWAAQGGNAGWLVQATEGLCRYCDLRVRYEEGVSACRFAADSLAAWLELTTEGLRAWVGIATWQARFSRLSGQAEDAERLLRRALERVQDPRLAHADTRSERAALLFERAEIAMYADREQARQWYAESLALYEALGDRWAMARSLSALGSVAHSIGDYGGSWELYGKCLSIQQALGDRRGIADSQIWMGFSVMRQGQIERGVDLVHQATTLQGAMGDRAGAGRSLCRLGQALYWVGRYAESERMAEQSASICQEVGLGVELAMSTCLGSMACLQQADYAGVRAWVERGFSVCRRMGYLRERALLLFVGGAGAFAEGSLHQAWDMLDEALAIYQPMKQRDEAHATMAWLGYTARAMDRPGEAWRWLRRALEGGTEMRTFMPTVQALTGVALLLADRGEVPRAVELYALAERHPFVGQSRFFEDVAGKQIASAAEGLPPEVVEGAKERGRARDLWETAQALLEELEATHAG